MNSRSRHCARDGGRGGEVDGRLQPRAGGESRGAEPAEDGQTSGRGERHRPEPPPPHRDTHAGSSHRPGTHLGTPAGPQAHVSPADDGAGRAPRRTSADRPPPAGQPNSSLPYPRGALFPSHAASETTQDAATAAGPATAAGVAATGRPRKVPRQGTERPLGRRPGTRGKPAGITLHTP